MAKLPELPVWLKPYTADELEQEERRNQDALRRGEAAFGDDGLIAHYRAKGDPLLEFADITLLVIAAMPERTLVGLTHLFVLSTKMGQFPTPGAGLGALDTVTDLFDFFHLRAAAGQDFTPTLWMVEAAPLAMRARRAVWAEWLRAQGLAVHPLLTHGLTIDHQPDNRAISAVDHRAQTADHPISDPALPRGVPLPNQQPLLSGRGNTAYNDDAVVARAREIYRGMAKPTKTKAAKAAIEEYKCNNPLAEQPAISEKAWIVRISRKM